MKPQHKHTSVAPYNPPPPPSWVSPTANGSGFVDSQPPRQTISHTESNAAPMPTLFVVLAADLVIGVILFLGLHYAVELDPGAAFLFAIFAVLCLTLFAIAWLSGQLPALFEVLTARFTNRDHIRAQTRLWSQWLHIQETQAEAERIRAEANLVAAQNEEAAYRLAIAAQSQTQEDKNRLVNYRKPTTFTAADPMPDPIFLKVMDFVTHRLFQNVDTSTGRIPIAVPWGKTGELSPNEAKRALEWVNTVNSKATNGALFFYRDRAWHLNIAHYATPKAVMDELEREPLTRD